jgi:hypothetical protein
MAKKAKKEVKVDGEKVAKVKGQLTDAMREARGQVVLYKGYIPTNEDYKKLLTIIVNDRGKESILRIKPQNLEATKEKWGKALVRVLGKGVALVD